MDNENIFTEEMDNREEAVTERAVWKEPDAEEETAEEENLVIKFKKPYLFEGKEYTELNLSCLENMTAADLIAVDNQYNRKHPGFNVMPEVKVGYAIMMAARAAQLPIEFFERLPQKEAVKIKNRVMGFLFGSD